MVLLSKLAGIAAATLCFTYGSPSGAQEYPPPIQALQTEGLRIVAELPSVSGLKGYAGYIGQQPYALYLTPDGEHVLVGSAFDAEGKNLTLEPLKAAIAEPMSRETLAQLAASHWILDGAETAPRVIYVFTDPNCPYCQKFWKQARPWVKAGKVQLRHIMVGILSETSPAKAAAILAAADPAEALRKHEDGLPDKGVEPLASIPPDEQAALLEHQALMKQLGMQATPAIFYRDADGMLRSLIGAPTGAELEIILGPL
jgi:thiol:disulfide interchange protein DsbG